MDKDKMYARLKAPFKASKVSWRVGSMSYHDQAKKEPKAAIALAYLDARDVMNRLDEVFGLNWQCRYSHADKKTVCEIGVLVDDVWIWRANGAGDSDIEAEKGALSDAFKRAAVLFGIGQYLYDLPNEWHEVDAYKRFKKPPTLPKGFYPEVTQKQAVDFVERIKAVSGEYRQAIIKEARFACSEAEDKAMWDFIQSAIKEEK